MHHRTALVAALATLAIGGIAQVAVADDGYDLATLATDIGILEESIAETDENVSDLADVSNETVSVVNRNSAILSCFVLQGFRQRHVITTQGARQRILIPVVDEYPGNPGTTYIVTAKRNCKALES